jgi:hypothetical protein
MTFSAAVWCQHYARFSECFCKETIGSLILGNGLTRDENGSEIPIDFTFGEVMPGATRVPKPYRCSSTVRSAQRERIMKKELVQGIQYDEIDFAKLGGT